MIRRPPRSTLFPTRRSSDLMGQPCLTAHLSKWKFPALTHSSANSIPQKFGSLKDLKVPLDVNRSEEHTSELQSRLHLVCRLLLEKKKKKNIIYMKFKTTQDV